MIKSPGRLRFAIYDCPRIVSQTLSKTLEDHGHVVLFDGPLIEKDPGNTKINAAPEADIWITKWTDGLTEAFIREFHPKKGIITISSGKGHIHEETLRSLGLQLENCPTFSSNSVAEHAITLALRGLYSRPPSPPIDAMSTALLPALSVKPVIFSHFSDEFAEQAVAQILMRVRQLDESIGRAKSYHYRNPDRRRPDESWTNEELESAKIGIIGRDRSAVKLARILHDGFECKLYGFDSSESLTFHGVKPMFITDILNTCDYVFMCTDRYGFLISEDVAETSLRRGLVDSRLLPVPDMTISDSNVAVLGTGGIGSIIARIALKGFKCRVTAYSRSEKQNLAGDGVTYFIPDKHENALMNAVKDANFIFISAKVLPGTPPLVDSPL
ncbi:MAG: hypothetical protein L0Y74_11655, partial [candidate division Zixibacteria bacterium]|nr:hypothetical protein [candidate division Zixibacteria bacterium]